MFQEERRKSIKVLGLKEVWGAQDTEMRPAWFYSPPRPCDPPAPAFHPPVDADATGAMSQDISFMLFSALNKMFPGSNTEALVWLCGISLPSSHDGS